MRATTAQSRATALRAKKEADSQALSQQIAKARKNGGADERERTRRRLASDIESFHTFMRATLDAQRSPGPSPTKLYPPASFKMICAVIKQRAQEDSRFIEPEHRKTLGFHYLMVAAPTYWISIAEQLLDHVYAGITADIVALGPFRGLRVSTRAILMNGKIISVIQLRTAIANGTIKCDEDIAGNGLTRRRWSDLLAWLNQQPG